jgi:hypothetical protein
MTVEDEPARIVLVVRGPGVATTTHDFPDLATLMAFAAVQEQELQQQGFQLQARAERRASDRLTDPRTEGLDRRRQGPR